ncbi:C10 family peptidase [Belliella marina]|uniref:C10 family peptidase n=1 Tax=Belliella marina TaxID=1644146 RepID=A0ABW4VI47_9BACT
MLVKITNAWKYLQMGGFNDALPFITCSGTNFQVFAGCVPIAMGQVMRYYQYPYNYDWASIPLTSWGATTTTANFIADIHDAIGNMYSGQPMYDCNGTGVSASANMGNVFKNKFNYSSASWADFNRNVVRSNIANYSRPVILSGDNGITGHMWVFNGYRSTTFYFDDCTGVSFLSLHINWGWLNGSNNGWYSFQNFNPGNTHFNNNKKK